eukprot:3291390-Pleurochrysis_carterae.AAC.4
MPAQGEEVVLEGVAVEDAAANGETGTPAESSTVDQTGAGTKRPLEDASTGEEADDKRARPAATPGPADEVPTAAPAGGRICFTFLNKGSCTYAGECRFRHLMPEHPDAVADRVRTGHVGKLPTQVCDARTPLLKLHVIFQMLSGHGLAEGVSRS